MDASVGTYSCTVEMALLDREFDVAIIDEIQLIGDTQRGWAWSNAVLGLRAKEIHLCGEGSIIELVKEMCSKTGDEVIVNEYKRLSVLNIQNEPLKDFSQVKKGDCVISFSRRDIFAIRREIETMTTLKCAVIYGNLPPGINKFDICLFINLLEIRSEQAKLFNQPGSGYDVLVASDAIGMGLNLNVSRVIFDTVEKYDGPIAIPHAKQIAGRAGRFGTDYPEGFVAGYEHINIH